MRIAKLVLLPCLLVAAAAGAVLHPTSHGARASAAPPSRPSGACTLKQSPAGYPDRYVRRLYGYTVHPPLPDAAWHGPGRPVAAKVQFHSLFHGYLIVAYRADLAAPALRTLRRWVQAHARQRVVATPTADPSAPRLDLAEWGWELSCGRVLPGPAVLTRFAARRFA